MQHDWQSEFRPALSAPLLAWLMDPHSFMQRLKRHGVHDATIEVIRQSYADIDKQEAQYLGLNDSATILIREVWIASPASTWMYARTVIPETCLEGRLASLRELDNQALGTLLFSDAAIQRSAFDFAYLPPEAALYASLGPRLTVPPLAIPARCSLFSWDQKNLLLTEYFSAELAELSEVRV